MNALDQGRIDRARERLESAAGRDSASDPAIRIVKLNPPEAGAESLQLNRKLTMLSGLSGSGRRTLFGTIDGMQRDAGLSAEAHSAETFEIEVDPNNATAAVLLRIIDSCEQAMLLSGAEMRGADMVLADLDEKIRSLQNSPDSEVDTPEAPVRRPEFDAFITQVLDLPADADSIVGGLAALSRDPRRVALKAACSLELDEAAGGPKLFGSSVRGQSNLVRAEAEGELSEYDMTPGSPAYVLASRLEVIGIPTSPLDAAEVATALLTQIEEAQQHQAAYAESVGALTCSAAELASERELIVTRRGTALRRQSTQQHLRRIARSQLDADSRARGLMPVLIEEPFADLPDELTQPTLSMLLKHTELAQVILVASDVDVRAWCDAIDDRAQVVDATGWFAQERDGW